MGFTQEQDDQFGDGESVGGDRIYDPPIYVSAGDDECTEYTYSEGKNGQFLIADGHKNATEFYEEDERGRSIGHAHYGPHGEMYHGPDVS
jgi:hypothetical protein cdivTM_02958